MEEMRREKNVLFSRKLSRAENQNGALFRGIFLWLDAFEKSQITGVYCERSRNPSRRWMAANSRSGTTERGSVGGCYVFPYSSMFYGLRIGNPDTNTSTGQRHASDDEDDDVMAINRRSNPQSVGGKETALLIMALFQTRVVANGGIFECAVLPEGNRILQECTVAPQLWITYRYGSVDV